MQELTIDEAADLIRWKDPRYEKDAYHFVSEALKRTQKSLCKGREIRHVSGQELLEGIRAYGIEHFGPMAMMVFESWGVRTCEDFGEIVFNMVEIGLLAKTEKDSRADFSGGYDFYEAFRKPFLPPSKLARAPISTKNHRSEVSG